jgi:hypothetical protein
VPNVFYQRVGNSLTWVLQWTAQGKLNTMGLGPASRDRLKEVGRLIAKYKEIIKAGGDPREARDEERKAAGLKPVRSTPDPVVRTFRDAARAYLAEFDDQWTQAHTMQWSQTLRDYVYPVIGDVPVAQVGVEPRRGGAAALVAHEAHDGQEGAQPHRDDPHMGRGDGVPQRR